MRRLGPRERAGEASGMLWDLPALSGLGDSLCCPLWPWAVLASLLSHELASGGLGGRN